nr:MarR family winged helix-turn-helix transcriptional regulator [Roseospira visakhapatnamensis]
MRLTSTDWQLLGAVALAGQPMTTPMIAETMGLTRQGTQKRLNKMVGEGYFQQRPNPRHERSPLYVLTERGSLAFEKAMALHARWARTLVEDLNARHLDHALEVLKALDHRLDRVTIPGSGAWSRSAEGERDLSWGPRGDARR